MPSDGYCNQCAELHDVRPDLVIWLTEALAKLDPRRQQRTWGAICRGCGMTEVDLDGNCVGHNHGVDLRRKREAEILSPAQLDALAEQHCGGDVALWADLPWSNTETAVAVLIRSNRALAEQVAILEGRLEAVRQNAMDRMTGEGG